MPPHCASTSAEIGFSLDLFTILEIEANSFVFVEHEKIRPCSRYRTISRTIAFLLSLTRLWCAWVFFADDGTKPGGASRRAHRARLRRHTDLSVGIVELSRATFPGRFPRSRRQNARGDERARPIQRS